MSSPSIHTDRAPITTVGETARRGASLLDGPVRSVAFWLAVALPFLHVPLLLSGINSTPDAVAFAVLLAVNVVALVVGHPYGRE